MRKNSCLVPVLVLILFLTGCDQGIKDPLNWELKEFTSINQEGKEMGLDNFKGKVWMADFIFTNCETVCPPMTANMTKLQEKVKEEGLNIEIVSFSVDPTNDKPEKLKEYVLKFNDDISNWNLLTGYTQEYIEDYALTNFKTVVKKPEIDNQVIHGTSFFLINQDGKVVKDYDGLTVPYNDIIKDIKLLLSNE